MNANKHYVKLSQEQKQQVQPSKHEEKLYFIRFFGF